MTGPVLCSALELHSRVDPDFFDALVALRFLDRDEAGPETRYRNPPETTAFLDRNSPQFRGGSLEMDNTRLYRFWGDLAEGVPLCRRESRAANKLANDTQSICSRRLRFSLSGPGSSPTWTLSVGGRSAGDLSQPTTGFW